MAARECERFVSPPIALWMGQIVGRALPHPYGREAKMSSKYLLQASVVGLGFEMNLQQVIQAGRSGFIPTALGITFALLVGMGLGALFQVQLTGTLWLIGIVWIGL